MAGSTAHSVDVRCYAYTRTKSDVSGALMTRYDETTPQVWKVPLKDDIRPGIVVEAPGAGYVVPAADASWVAAVLKAHGVEYRLLGKPWQGDAEAFRASKSSFSTGSVETHQRLTVEGRWQHEARSVPAGSLFVPIAQAKSRLVMALLEPLAPDALLAWGRFNNAFERKEYMEDYVAEEEARKMLAKDPALKAAFEQKLKDDPNFALSLIHI